MQNAEKVLSILNQKSKNDKSYVFNRLYRNLFNEDFFTEAYRKIHSKEGNMTEGTDGKTIDGFGGRLVKELIEQLKAERYYPQPVRRTYIPKKNGKLRPLGIPAFRDKLVQEVVREVLEAIYEPVFLDTSHGFRPNRSCHTALQQILIQGKGTTWVVEGDIKGFFDNINHEVLLRLLSRKIQDGRFIELIRRFLKSGYLEFETVHNSLSGTPQGGIISPILANIYLHELDNHMEELCKRLSKGNQRKPNPEYDKLIQARFRAKRAGETIKADEILCKMRTMHSKEQMDTSFARVRYIRYADDFLICVIGSKELASSIKQDVSTFLKETLTLELSQEKTLITNLQDRRVKFLGYEISKMQCDTKLTKSVDGIVRRSVNGGLQLLVPSAVIQSKIQQFTAKGKPVAHRARLNMPVLDIIEQYNAEIRGLYNYYKLAMDVSNKLGKFRYYHYYSLAKTIAQKEKSSVPKIIKKYGVSVPCRNGKGTRNVIGVSYQIKSGKKIMAYFSDPLKWDKRPDKNVVDRYAMPNKRGCQLIQRLNARKCELCGCENGNFEVHHIRKLKDITQKYNKRGASVPIWVKQMSRMNRKTLVLCEGCHRKLHSGKI